jgi:hypothetical protein
VKKHLDFIAERLRLMSADPATIHHWADRFFIVGDERADFVAASSPPPDFETFTDDMTETIARRFAAETAS